MSQWILTREAGDAGEERPVLLAHQQLISDVPCLQTAFEAWPWLDGDELTLFTSQRSVEAWARSGAPAPRRCAAMAPTTASKCLSLGLNVELHVEGGVVALARALVARTEWSGRLRYPTSPAGLASDEQAEALAVLSQRFEVQRRVVYVTQAPHGLSAQLAPLLHAEWSVVLASPSAVQHFLSAVPTRQAPHHVVCQGSSTLRAWNSLRPEGWPSAVPVNELSRLLTEVKS